MQGACRMGSARQRRFHRASRLARVPGRGRTANQANTDSGGLRGIAPASVKTFTSVQRVNTDSLSLTSTPTAPADGPGARDRTTGGRH